MGSGLWMIVQYSVKVFVVYAGGSSDCEVERVVVMVSRAAGSFHPSDALKYDLNYLLGQMQCRKKKFENVFFTIDWKLILAVSL